jgi:hypothetical protein
MVRQSPVMTETMLRPCCGLDVYVGEGTTWVKVGRRTCSARWSLTEGRTLPLCSTLCRARTMGPVTMLSVHPAFTPPWDKGTDWGCVFRWGSYPYAHNLTNASAGSPGLAASSCPQAITAVTRHVQ